MRGLTVDGSSSSNPLSRQLILLATGFTIAAGGITGYSVWQSRSPQPTAAQSISNTPAIKTVTALGRLEPRGEVIKLSAPTSSQENRIEQLLVKAGDRVQAGQIIAILDSRDRLQAALGEAQEQVRVAQAKLAQVQAGDSKQNQLAAQQSNIARLEAQLRTETIEREAEITRAEAELRNADRTYQRYQSLYNEGAESAVNADERREKYETSLAQLNRAKAQHANTVSTLQAQIQQERSSLKTLSEVRPVDVQAAQAEVNSAIAAMNQAKASLNQAYVRSPQNGVVMEIHTRPGELVSQDGIAEIGQTNQMYAVAEVYQSDVSKIRPGQRVHISGDSLSKELQGTVERVGWQVKRQNVINTDPSANIDSRIVEVHVRLDNPSSQIATKFTNLQIKAVIETASRN
ncbi:MAG: ABC exporter membrane fusion protein [Leptolyngbyaceae cyanobacterium RU_5_1]|nr:ABC exporter membrane fusion protein [Leptolyngbyaceae cyanobacterium RU_5_1]